MSELRVQRWAVSAVFFAHGVMIASWASHIPHVKSELGLGDGALGIVLLFLAAGAVAAMLLTGPLAARKGSDVMTRVMTLAMAATLLLPLAMPSVAALAVSLALFGAALGSMDVAMNAVASEVEVRYERPIMSSFHGMFSAGALAGALIAAFLIGAGIPPLAQVVVIVIVVLVLAAPALRKLPASKRFADAPTRISLPRGRLLVLGIMAFAVMLAEGSVVDWGATYLRDDLGAAASTAALAFGAFSVTMALGRFAGDAISRRLGPSLVVRAGAGIAVVGLGFGLLVATPVSMIIGFAVMGAGLANIIPIIFSASAAAGRTQAEGIGGSATLGYLGFLAGPPLIGVVAAATSLTFGFALVVGMMAVVAIGASMLNPQTAPEAAAV